MIRPLLAFAIAVSTVSPAAAQTAPPELMAYPELVLINGQVLTVDAQFAVAEAVAVRDGRILAVGSSAEIRRLIAPDAND